jgi:GNAT superfamily N-acetyltransferase
MISVDIENPSQAEAVQLLQEFCEDLANRYRDLSEDGLWAFRPEELTPDRTAFVLAKLDGKPVGCGALCVLDDEIAEIKRLFVVTRARGHGVAARILAKLEELARDFGYEAIRLETGVKQPESIALFGKAGYYRIPNFGRYAESPVSACFEKRI